MTTRRRRAGSESSPFDSIGEVDDNHQGAEQQNQQTVNPFVAAQVQNPLQPIQQVRSNLSWGTPHSTSASPQEAYYKKTDAPLVPQAAHNTQYLNHNNTNNNIGYSSSNGYVNNSSNGHINNSNSGVSNNSWHNFSEGISNYLTTNLSANFTSDNHPGSTEHHYANNTNNNQHTFSGGCGVSDLLEYPELTQYTDTDTSSMACRDRSGEFAGIIRSQQQGHLSNGAARGAAGKPGTRDIAQYSAFMKRSRMVGRNISSTYAKLEKLTMLARKRSLFDDSQDAEVQQLTGIIRHDLSSLTKQLEELRKTSASSSAANDASSSRHMQKHSANLVGSLQTKVAGIAQKFKDVLEVRTENLKRQAQRREQFTGNSGTMAMAGGGGKANGGYSLMDSSPHTASVLLADEAKANMRQPNGDVVLDFDGVVTNTSNNNSGGGYQQQLMLMEEQDSLLQARAETMKTIESTIVELGTMFTQLATMVKEQDELVHRIDANVDDAEMNVEAAHTELLKYFKSVSSNRWLMMKVFGIVVVFFIIFVVFAA